MSTGVPSRSRVIQENRQSIARAAAAVATPREQTRVPAALLAAGWIVVALGLILRLYGAGSKSLWFDEVATVATSYHTWKDIQNVVQMPGINTPPLFFYLFKVWMFGGTADTWLRTATALMGAGVVALTWLIGRRMFGPAIALVATALCAISSYEIYYSQYLRAYVMLALLGLLSLYLILRAVETNRTVWWLLWALSAAASLYTFYYAIFFLAGEGAWLLAMAVRRRELLLPAVLWGAVACLLYLPWVPAMLAQYHHTGTRAWIRRPTLQSLVDIYDQFSLYALGGHRSWLLSTARYVRDLTIIPFGLGLLLPGQRKERGLLLLFLLCGVLLPIVASLMTQPLYDPRYEVCAAAAYYLIVARGLIGWFVPLRRRIPAAVLAVPLAALLLIGIAGAYTPLHEIYASSDFSQADSRDATALILHSYMPGDIVIHSHEFTYLTMVWYAYRDGAAGTKHIAQAYPWVPKEWVTRAPLPQYRPLPALFPALLARLSPQAGRLWLVSQTAPGDRKPPAWFHPPAAQWRLAQDVRRYHDLIVRLYVRR